MKKLIALTLALCLLLALSACTVNQTTTGSANNEALAKIPAVEDLTKTDTSKIIGLEDGVLTVGM